MTYKVNGVEPFDPGKYSQKQNVKKANMMPSYEYNTEWTSPTPGALDAYKAMVLYKKPDASNPQSDATGAADSNNEFDYIPGLSPFSLMAEEMYRNLMIQLILRMLEMTDQQDDGVVNGSVYDDPEVADLLRSFGVLDDGSNFDSIRNTIKRSNGQTRKNAISKMQSLHRKGLEREYDTYIDKKGDTTPNANIGTVPGNKPSYIDESDWKKIKQLSPKMQAAACTLFEKAHERGLEFHISSGLRTHEQQERIYKTARKGYAAKPGSSQHELGNAMDIKASPEVKQQLGKIWKDEMGLKWGATFRNAPEDWHFDIRPA